MYGLFNVGLIRYDVERGYEEEKPADHFHEARREQCVLQRSEVHFV